MMNQTARCRLKRGTGFAPFAVRHYRSVSLLKREAISRDQTQKSMGKQSLRLGHATKLSRVLHKHQVDSFLWWCTPIDVSKEASCGPQIKHQVPEIENAFSGMTFGEVSCCGMWVFFGGWVVWLFWFACGMGVAHGRSQGSTCFMGKDSQLETLRQKHTDGGV
jgi:hypothetical protein